MEMMEITDAFGKVVDYNAMKANGSFTIDLLDAARGVYFVRYKVFEQLHTERVVVQW
jgi:hypothetical protein